MNKQELRQKDINYYSGSHRDSGYRYKIVNFELFLQITKIVTKSTQEGTEISASALFFYVAGVKIIVLPNFRPAERGFKTKISRQCEPDSSVG